MITNDNEKMPKHNFIMFLHLSLIYVTKLLKLLKPRFFDIFLQLLKHPKNVQISFSQKSFGKTFHKTIKNFMVRKFYKF